MTAIAAVISNRGIACATDSMVTAKYKDNYVIVEWEKSKIIKVERCKACISYWGFAGLLKAVPNKGENSTWTWNTYDWLTKKVTENKHTNLSDFCGWLKNEIITEFTRLPGKMEEKGLGMHIVGHELVKGFYIPEFFLLSSFGYSNGGYLAGKEFQLYRQTYHTISKDGNVNLHHEEQYRLAVREHLNSGKMIFYNNGDPQFFNPIARAVYTSLHLAQTRALAKEMKSAIDLVPFVREPISLISDLQKAFHREGSILIGGRVHSMVIEPHGNFIAA